MSLLTDFEVEVGGDFIFSVKTTLTIGELWDQQRDEGGPQGGRPVQGLAAASEGFHILSYIMKSAIHH